MITELVKRNRSYRRFYEDFEISKELLTEFVGLARLCPSSRNFQSLKFMLSYNSISNEKIFPHLTWAGYLKNWDRPEEGERPSAYIIILGDTQISSKFSVDIGITAQTILLGAISKDLGGCMIGSINKPKLRESLKIPKEFEISLVIALGKPKEEIIIEDINNDGDIKYYRDTKGKHHVPKRKIENLIIL